MIVWVVIRMTYPFAIVGVFSSEDAAVGAASSDLDFVGPITLDEMTPTHEPWPGGYYPHARPERAEA